MLEEAVERYRKGEISIGKFAELVDVGCDEAGELLIKAGVEIKHGSESVEKLSKGVGNLLEIV